MIQFHALGLLYQIKKRDQLAVSKLVAKLSRSSLRSPYACCLLIRVAFNLIETSGEGTSSQFFEFIENCLRHRHEMVIYEAAHAMVNMNGITAKDLAPAVSVLQLFCSSPKPTLRYYFSASLLGFGVGDEIDSFIIMKFTFLCRLVHLNFLN